MSKLKAIIVILLVVFVAFFGCVQNPPGEQQPANLTGNVLIEETSDLTTGLDDFSDLQNSLDDASLGDSGIDANSFGP